jgi:tRNA A37 threonylcarbamoyladenosine synthetase subunit TsaC/SUA5/YrdC
VKKLAPNLKGVTEAVRVLSDGEVVVIPTESVYMACTTISPSDLLASHTSLNHCKF